MQGKEFAHAGLQVAGWAHLEGYGPVQQYREEVGIPDRSDAVPDAVCFQVLDRTPNVLGSPGF